MTRKEPQFNDEGSATVLDVSPTETLADALPSSEATAPPVNRTPWLLWFLVVISLALSFGMAFFGLDEAGRYQAALDRAESQAAALEETIERLNKAQTQGIGELAQSDAQMRQTVASLEARLQGDLESQLAPLKSTQSDLAEAQNATSQSMNSLRKVLDERLALVSEQINIERNRIDELSGLNSALQSLEKIAQTTQLSVQSIQTSMAQLSENLEAIERAQQQDRTRVDQVAFELGAVEENITQLRKDPSQALALDLAVEQIERLSVEVSKQGQLLQAVDASRKQLTQRLIDLDERLNLALQPRE